MTLSTTHDPVYGCDLWTGPTDKYGYPLLNGRRAYRPIYEERYGPIPPKLEVDHFCRRRACVRHFELVTRSENERRKSWRRRAKQKRCSEGHDLFRHGRRTPEGGKICLTCWPVR